MSRIELHFPKAVTLLLCLSAIFGMRAISATENHASNGIHSTWTNLEKPGLWQKGFRSSTSPGLHWLRLCPSSVWINNSQKRTFQWFDQISGVAVHFIHLTRIHSFIPSLAQTSCRCHSVIPASNTDRSALKSHQGMDNREYFGHSQYENERLARWKESQLLCFVYVDSHRKISISAQFQHFQSIFSSLKKNSISDLWGVQELYQSEILNDTGNFSGNERKGKIKSYSRSA
jgi:hypothetical protein